MKVLTVFLLAAAVMLTTPVFAQDAGNTGTNMEILLEKVKADKKLLVAANMDFTDEEGKKFWPLYDAYQKELEQLDQRLGKAIMEYTEAYNKGPIPNDTANELMWEVLSIEVGEVKSKRSYAEKICEVLSATKTARYMQIETKIRALLKFELAQQIPLVY
jgi:hypothetical protein